MPAHPFSLQYTPTTGVIPGGGFAGSTSTPSAAGSSGAAGYGENAIARWSSVPYQTVTGSGSLSLGVVAEHVEGIARVEFSVDGGPWFSVTSRSRNPSHAPASEVAALFAATTGNGTYHDSQGKPEYCCTVVRSRHADGLHELRARVYPVNGRPRVLSGMYFSTFATAPATTARYVAASGGNDSNDGLTPEAPKATMVAAANAIQAAQGDAEGGVVYLLAGSYVQGLVSPTSANTSRWLTVTHAPGLTRDQVTITGVSAGDSSGFNTKLIRYYDLTFTGPITAGGELVDWTWIDHCVMSGPTAQYGGDSATDNVYVTDSTFAGSSVPTASLRLARNVYIESCEGDVLSGNDCSINVVIGEIVQQVGDHSNLWQNTGTRDNCILYGVTLLASNVQPFQHNVPITDFAVAECNVNSTEYSLVFGNADADYFHHYFVRDCNFTGTVAGTVADTSSNYVVEGTTFNGLSLGQGGYPSNAGVTFR